MSCLNRQVINVTHNMPDTMSGHDEEGIGVVIESSDSRSWGEYIYSAVIDEKSSILQCMIFMGAPAVIVGPIMSMSFHNPALLAVVAVVWLTAVGVFTINEVLSIPRNPTQVMDVHIPYDSFTESLSHTGMDIDDFTAKITEILQYYTEIVQYSPLIFSGWGLTIRTHL